MPPSALTVKCLLTMVCPFCVAVMVTCHVPPEPRSPLPSYIPLPLSVRADPCIHGSHSHGRHGRHIESDDHFGSADRAVVRAGQLYAKDVAALVRW